MNKFLGSSHRQKVGRLGGLICGLMPPAKVGRMGGLSCYFSRGLILWPPPGDQAMSAYPLSITPKIVDFCYAQMNNLGPGNSVVVSVRWWRRRLGVGLRAHFFIFAMVLSWSPSAVLSLFRWPATRSRTRTPNYPKNLPCSFYFIVRVMTAGLSLSQTALLRIP